MKEALFVLNTILETLKQDINEIIMKTKHCNYSKPLSHDINRISHI